MISIKSANRDFISRLTLSVPDDSQTQSERKVKSSISSSFVAENACAGLSQRDSVLFRAGVGNKFQNPRDPGISGIGAWDSVSKSGIWDSISKFRDPRWSTPGSGSWGTSGTRPSAAPNPASTKCQFRPVPSFSQLPPVSPIRRRFLRFRNCRR